MNAHFDFVAMLRQPENKVLLDKFSPRKYGAGRILWDSPPEENGIFVIVSGSLRVYLSYEGREFSLFFLNPGDLFTTHSGAIIESWKETEVLYATLADFEDILKEVPEVSITCFSLIGRVLSNVMQIVEGIAFRDVRYRLAHLLLELAEEKGRPCDGGIAVDIDFNTEDMATMIGSSRQSTSLTLNELFKSGDLERPSRNLLLIRHPDKLRNLTKP